MSPFAKRLDSLQRSVDELPSDQRSALSKRIERMRTRLAEEQPIDRSLAALERDLIKAQRGEPLNAPKPTPPPKPTAQTAQVYDLSDPSDLSKPPRQTKPPQTQRKPKRSSRGKPRRQSGAQFRKQRPLTPEQISRRAAAIPSLNYPELPVTERREDLLAAIREHPVVIVCGDTGSGKTTQLPKLLLELGHGVSGTIGCTQPRRIAAVSVAKRVADELKVQLGGPVGYQVRFDNKSGPGTLVKFMTDGILLAETQADPTLAHYDALIIDEAHERSLNIDFLLGYLHDLRKSRPELKLVISSATLDAGAFSAFFNDAPVVTVEGRMYPITDEYLPARNEDEKLHQHVARGVQLATRESPDGDILVFLPGEREIRLATDLLQGRRLPGTQVLPLYARLGIAEQQKVFAPAPGGQRRIVLATNVAETSLTIPGIRVVIDSGVARITGFNPRTQVQSLQVRPISQASARQRRGRCGRVGPGLCIRLYEEEDHDERAEFTPPEIRRSSLAGVILRMKSLGLSDITKFPFVDPPPSSLVKDGLRTLSEIGAIDEFKELTPLGENLARFPVDPRIARIVTAGHDNGSLREVLVLAAGLSVPDPRERPHEKTEAADLAHENWKDPRSDFLGLLKVWHELAGLPNKSALRRFCRKRFLSVRRVFEWQNILRELSQQVRQMYGGDVVEKANDAPPPTYEALHRALLAGLPSNIGTRAPELLNEEELSKNRGRKRPSPKAYLGARQRTFNLHPGSGLFAEPPEWVVAFSLVETTKLYARQAAEIDPAWLETVAPHLCKSRYAEPVWDAKHGIVNARESVACCGLQILSDRPADYGAVRPAEAREHFIRDALVPGRLVSAGPWLKNHLDQRRAIAALEQKLRRPNGLLDEHSIYTFFDERIPAGVFSTATFERWRSESQPDLNVPWETATYDHRDSFPIESLEAVLPDELHGCRLSYHCAPGDTTDGITLNCSLTQLDLVPPWTGDWLVPGWLTEKVILLLRTLPKQTRNPLHPINKTAQVFVDTIKPDGPLLPAICKHLRSAHGLHVTEEEFDTTRVPEHLRLLYCVRDKDGKPLAISRDLNVVRRSVARERGEAIAHLTPPEFHKTGERTWAFGILPASVDLGNNFTGHPALVDEGKTVGLRVFPERHVADIQHRLGMARLLRLTLPARFAHAREHHGLPTGAALALTVLGPEPKHNLPDLLDRAALQIAAQAGGETTALPRSARGFAAAMERVRADLHDCLAAHASLLDRITSAYDLVSERLEALRRDVRCRAAVADIDAQIHRLFRARFLRDATDLDEYPRYLDALARRLERLAQNSAKDAKKQARLKPYTEGAKQLPGHLDYLLQEFRIAVFAPEIGTKTKVSEAVLDRAAQGSFEVEKEPASISGSATSTSEAAAPETETSTPNHDVDTSALATDLAKAWGQKENR